MGFEPCQDHTGALSGAVTGEVGGHVHHPGRRVRYFLRLVGVGESDGRPGQVQREFPFSLGSSGCRAEATRVDENSYGFAVVSCAPDDGKLTGRQTGNRSTDEVFSLVDLGVTRGEEDYPES